MLRQRDIRRTLSGAGLLFIPAEGNLAWAGDTARGICGPSRLYIGPRITQDIALSVPQRRKQIVFASEDGIRLIVEANTEDTWLEPVLREFARLLGLQANWDSYGAREINSSSIRFALEELLPFAMRPNTPLPAVVPTHRGGVQLEWHARGIDLEVEVIAPGRLYVFYHDQRTGESWEREILADLRPLSVPFDELTRRN